MDNKEKVVRLVDVGELESSLKKDLAEEEAKGKSADILFCESIEDELSDLENLPTIDPESLRPVARLEPVDPESDIEFKCSKCEGVISTDWDGIEDFEYCPYCGARTRESI
nr:MAG TPA: DNA-directed RNA polymerase [Caudoviricetes sp.]